jgi:tetratricopeptide (TPR) repeat protein
MPASSSLSKTLFVIATCLALAGCKSDAERADEYFQSGMELLQAGDVDRAIVEFRNVFQFEENHLQARMAMGNIFLEQNNPGAAYGQFLRVVEQYPEDFEARRTLAELAFAAGNWDELMRHGAVAVQMMPEDPRVQAIDLGMKYREAALAEDDPARQALTSEAEALLESLPESAILNNLLIDSYTRDGLMSQALAPMDTLLAVTPDARQLHIRRLALLAQMQDMAAVEAQLAEMVERFPGDEEIQGMLFRYYVSQQRLDEAEAFLRELADPAAEDPANFLSLINFVSQVRGEQAARAEIERAIEVNPSPNRFKSMLALLDFQAGAQDKAIADLEAILTGADPADEVTQGIKTTLARMLVSTGNQVGARRQVEEVLAQNASNVDALKMQAAWQLQADEVDAAIANLRVALDTAPEDIQVMNLMSEAYTRLGDANLARDYLAQAVEVSGNAPEPSLRYARVLFNEERYLPAEDVILPALQQNPRNVDLLGLLGQVYLQLDDGARATQVIDTLGRIDSDQARALANSLQADLLSRQSGSEEALAFLENLAASGEAGLREQVTLMRARLQVGETAEALGIAERLVAENPDNLGLKLALSSAQTANGDLEAAEATLRDITAAAPEANQPWLQLVRLAQRQGDPDKAVALIDQALEATNRHPNILWAKASVLEREGDIDGAIAIYEDLYAQNSGSIIVANNLASLLATYRDDAASLERAWVVGRRLKDLDNPALQDTYGWILFRRGEAEAALPYLESAANALDDPIVEAHLGFAYAALGRNEEAIAQLQKAVDLAGPADTRERIEAARAEITRLRSLPEN